MEKWKSQLMVGDTVYFTHGSPLEPCTGCVVSARAAVKSGFLFSETGCLLRDMPGVDRSSPWVFRCSDSKMTFYIMIKALAEGEYCEVDEKDLFRTYKAAVRHSLCWYLDARHREVERLAEAKNAVRVAEAKLINIGEGITELQKILSSRKAGPKK